MIKQGTKVTCPKCEALIGVVAYDIHSGMRLEVGMLIYGEMTYEGRDLPACKKCGSYWYFHGKLHTPDGWQSG